MIGAAVVLAAGAAFADEEHRITADGVEAESGMICIQQLRPDGSPTLFPPSCYNLEEKINLFGVPVRLDVRAVMPEERVELRDAVRVLKIMSGVRE